MTPAPQTTAAPAPEPWSRTLTIAIAGLGVTQIVAWGAIYYALTVLGPSITADFGWASHWTFVGFSAALVTAGFCSPVTGRMIDRFGGRPVMIAGSVVAAAGLALLAGSASWAGYLAAWIVLGLAKAMVLYEAAFATLAQISVVHARRAIIYLSFLGGLASTVSWPVTGLLHAAVGWRSTYGIYAGLTLLVSLPIHWLALPRFTPKEEPAAATPVEGGGGRQLHSQGFLTLASVLLAGSFALLSFMWSGISVHLLTLLGLLGFASVAGTLIGAIIGPSQVLGRVGDMLFGGRVHPIAMLRISTTLLPLAFGVLLLGGGTSLSAVVFAVGYGVAIGMNTIARGAVPLALFGPKGYGARLGRLAAPSFVAEAAAPIVYAGVIGRWGAWTGLWLAAMATVLAWAGILVLAYLRRRDLATGPRDGS